MTVERQTLPRSARRFVGGVSIAILLFLVTITTTLVLAGHETATGAITVLAILTATFALLYLWFRSTTMTVRIDADGVFVHFSKLFHSGRLIPWTDIVSWRVRPFRGFSEFGGWGIRWDLGKRTGYIWGGTSALELTLTSSKVIVITVVDEDTIRAEMGRRPTQ
jgi:hypothetical protein